MYKLNNHYIITEENLLFHKTIEYVFFERKNVIFQTFQMTYLKYNLLPFAIWNNDSMASGSLHKKKYYTLKITCTVTVVSIIYDNCTT